MGPERKLSPDNNTGNNKEKSLLDRMDPGPRYFAYGLAFMVVAGIVKDETLWQVGLTILTLGACEAVYGGIIKR